MASGELSTGRCSALRLRSRHAASDTSEIPRPRPEDSESDLLVENGFRRKSEARRKGALFAGGERWHWWISVQDWQEERSFVSFWG